MPSLILLPATFGALMYGPGVVIGHAILRYTVPCSFGNAYRTIPLQSSVIVGLVGGAGLGLLGAALIVLASFLFVTAYVVYQKLRFGKPFREISDPSKSWQSKDQQTKGWTRAFKLFIKVSSAAVVAICGSQFLHSVGYDLETLEGSHIVIAGLCGQLLCVAVVNLWLLRSQGNVALPISEPESATATSAGTTGSGVEDVGDKV